MRLALIIATALTLSHQLFAIPDKAPPAFGKKQAITPIDIEKVDINYIFDVKGRRANARATMHFFLEESGKPFFDLVPRPENLMVNAKRIDSKLLAETKDPDGVATFRFLDLKLPAGYHTLTVDYDISRKASFDKGAVRTGFFMSDLTTRRFFEQYGPANMEFDQIKYTFKITLLGTSQRHSIFTNGKIEDISKNQWKVEFPSYFTSSSIYFHLSKTSRFKVVDFEYQGQKTTFPVRIYSSSASFVRRAVPQTKKYLELFERIFGPYAHEKLVIYIAGNGGMEYAGATMTSMYALNHELAHSWFARGVMPANGNAGWIDEAIASWQDDHFRPGRQAPNRSPTNLGGFSLYRRQTTYAAYSQGEQLIRELDFLFKDQGGMLPILASFYKKFQRKVILVNDFQEHIEQATQMDMTDIFNRYVYGQKENLTELASEKEPSTAELRGHPKPYSEEELIRYR